MTLGELLDLARNSQTMSGYRREDAWQHLMGAELYMPDGLSVICINVRHGAEHDMPLQIFVSDRITQMNVSYQEIFTICPI